MSPNDVISLLQDTSGSNDKLAILKEHADNEVLQRVLQLTYDKVRYTFGVTMRNIKTCEPSPPIDLVNALDILEQYLSTRVVTGNKAITLVETMLAGLEEDDRQLVTQIINRDLRINMGSKQINKAIPKLITTVPYMRCSIYSTDSMVNGKLKKGTYRNISYPALCQLKADGTYRTAMVHNGTVRFQSRQGIEYHYPLLEELYSQYPDGVYIGEMVIRDIDNRADANGLLNSKNPPHERIQHKLWDYITLEEYADAKHKNKKIKRVPLVDRFSRLNEIIAKDIHMIQPIESYVVNSLDEALEHTIRWMQAGLEGSVLKDYSNVFKDHNSTTQLKLKIKFTIEVRAVAFIEGTPGTDREKTFGSIKFETDDKMIQGSVSGFNDKQLKDINGRRESFIGSIMEIEGNDLTKSVKNDFYAVSHPRFIEERTDRTTTDDMNRAFEALEMAKQFKGDS